MSSADRRGLARIHTRQRNFRGDFSHSARQGATPDAYDARATRHGSGRRGGSLSARADRASRFHLDAIDAADESQYPQS